MNGVGVLTRGLFRNVLLAAAVGLCVCCASLQSRVDPVAENPVATVVGACVSDCRPAPETWRCNGEWGACPLWYEPCRKLPT